ncbi:MAG TPA: TRAFs-binding domain-containing protein [Thermoanaerobaculia bacterium]|nr:TRAFs-binding domain-containing protein [Thermoanaerobaculia bacterium]
MSIVFVIYSPQDLDFVQGTLLRSLPSNGFDRWVSAAHLMAQCRVILAVISRAAVASPFVRDDIATALDSKRPVIAVLADCIEGEEQARLPKGLWALPLVDFTEDVSAAREDLADLLPPVGPLAEADELSRAAQSIEWNEEIFSASLADVVKRHDQSRARVLIETLARSMEHRPYPPRAANADLAVLRKDRQFKLMQRYAEAVLATGTTDAKVRRQYAQALIEQKAFDRALDVLASITQDGASPDSEVAEAYGLIGRTYKQQYVDAPNAPGSHELLRRAIEAYESVYEKNPTLLWHGVNAASCILRAHRDGVEGADPERAREIARRVLEHIDRLESGGRLIDVWDCASRVEALLALDRYEAAQAALAMYIHHPDMHAFEVSSTYRQFDQLLELGRRESRPILDQLWEVVERHRAGGLSGQPSPGLESAESATLGKMSRPLLIRVTDPDWQPAGITDLVLESRLGTIVSAQGTDASVAELLQDSEVMSVDQSRPGGVGECARSIPFIRVAADYPFSGGTYQENGDGALVAVIDNGIDVLHEAFLDGQGQSRIVGIWHQGSSTGTPPQGFTYGTYHTAADIAGYVGTKTLPAGLSRNPDGHGTHVASIAAGRAVGAFAGGVAPGARLLIVISAGQGPTGYSKSHLDALTFVDAVATELGLPVVVNLSQGMNAGAHDGTSALEVMFDAFSEGGRKPGRVVVKSAGNERNNKNGHAKVTLGQDGLDNLPWQRDAQASGVERLELWWSAADELDFRLGDPSNNWTPWVSRSAPKQSGSLNGVPFVLQLTKLHIDNGDSQLSVEIGNDTSTVPPGIWQLQIRSYQVPEGGTVHAWIERGLGAPSSFTRHMDEEITLSIPGTAKNVIAVGAVDADLPIQVGDFSSYGPTRDGRQKPEVAAPGVGVQAAKGGTSTGIRPDSGTSMAAPHVAGAIALLLSRMAKTQQPIPTSTQIASALRRKTRNYNGRWAPGQGFGIVDVAALLAAF